MRYLLPLCVLALAGCQPGAVVQGGCESELRAREAVIAYFQRVDGRQVRELRMARGVTAGRDAWIGILATHEHPRIGARYTFSVDSLTCEVTPMTREGA